MKTIFIPLFQGVEAKNILRTGVIGMLLERPDIRVVIFLKNKERADFYKKEFNHPRLIYEIADVVGVACGLDAFFAKLKFMLLRTETTNLRRRLRYEETRHFMQYVGGHFINWLCARSFLRKASRFLDYHFVAHDAYASYFDTYNPDLLFLAHLFDEREIHMLRGAKKRNTPSIGFINSWDKVTARCILRLIPDKMIVFNHLVKNELVEHNEMKESDMYIAGIPQYDLYTTGVPSSREVFFEKIGADPLKKLMVFAPAGKSDSESDWKMMDILYGFLQDGSFGDALAFLVRFQPNDEIDEKELEKRPYVLYDRPGTRFSKRGSIDWDMDNEDMRHLHDTLSHMDVLVCYGSSLTIDAAFLDKPVIHIGFEANPGGAPSKRTSRFYEMAHSKRAFSSGKIPRAHSVDELRSLMKKYLADPAQDHDKREVLVREQCVYRDGKSAERIASYILSALDNNMAQGKNKKS